MAATSELDYYGTELITTFKRYFRPNLIRNYVRNLRMFVIN